MQNRHPIIDEAFERAIQSSTFSGAQVVVGRGTERWISRACGNVAGFFEAPSITMTTLFDIASLTKPVCTTTLLMIAVDRSLLLLDDPIQKFLPSFDRPEKLTIRQLLQHRSGLPDYLPIYQSIVGKEWTYPQIESAFIATINEIPLSNPVGSRRVYSDLGFILLGFLLQKVFATTLDDAWREQVAIPWGMERTVFNPLKHGQVANEIAATEQCLWRNRLLQGQVHDDNAWVLGGEAGHAGLFSSAEDLEKFTHELIGVWQNRDSLFSQRTLETFIGFQLSTKLGWDTVSRTGSQAGRYFNPEYSIGHLAFTGCSLWVDLHDLKYVILLTNRVHPSRHQEGIKEFRPKIHDLLIESMQAIT